jgi:hypothetical protein
MLDHPQGFAGFGQGTQVHLVVLMAHNFTVKAMPLTFRALKIYLVALAQVLAEVITNINVKSAVIVVKTNMPVSK